MDNQVIIFTDGACRGNPGPGGWGAVLSFQGNNKQIYGAETQTTNNRMELQAVIKALQTLKAPCSVTINTDSTYVLKGMTEWIAGWKKKNWRTADKKPVKNVDLWKKLDVEAERHQIKWVWVKGHAGVEGNELADSLANRAIDEQTA